MFQLFKMTHSIFPVEDITKLFIEKVGKPLPVTTVSNCIFGSIEEEIGGICGTHGS
jgi:hypothetical protein